MKRKNRSSGKSTKSSHTEGSPRNHSCGSETLRIHFGQKRNTAVSMVSNRGPTPAEDGGYGGGDDTLELKRKMLNGVARAEGRKGSSNSLMLSASMATGMHQNCHGNNNNRESALRNCRTSSFNNFNLDAAGNGRRTFTPENPAAMLMNKRKSPTQLTCTLSTAHTPKSSITSWAANGESPEQNRRHELTPNGQASDSKFQLIRWGGGIWLYRAIILI